MGNPTLFPSVAAMRERLREAWAAIESQRKRAAEEWAEANRYFMDQSATLDARAAELASCEKSSADRHALIEAEVAGLRAEAASLDARIQHARTILAELESRRERAHAELLSIPPPISFPPSAQPLDLALRVLLLNREKERVLALKALLESEMADVDDRRRLVAEQLTQLTDARMQWQHSERQTIVEMEELARALRRREQELDAREQRLIRADARRRADAYDLWRLRLGLEAWQAKLQALELRSHSENNALESGPSAELAGLRQEVERLAALLLEELPERPKLDQIQHESADGGPVPASKREGNTRAA